MSSMLSTDAYKNAMAQAGAPLRRETFYLSFRKGGWQYVPYDLETAVREMIPTLPEKLNDEHSFINQHGYGLTGAMVEALRGEIEVRAVPAGTWVHQREPILTVTGPSFLVSWLEPHVLRLFYPLQLATLLKRHEHGVSAIDERSLTCTCDEHAGIAHRVIAAMGVRGVMDRVAVRSDAYRDWVNLRVSSLFLEGHIEDPNRIFEVGMRAAACEGQHLLALEVCREAGIMATSNIGLAKRLGMRPVGTMGHEHVQRWGDDLAAYRAMRDTRPAAPSYLLDTFDTITSGIPAAIRAMREREHACSIRYDSGDKFGQYIYAHGEFKRHGLEPVHIIEDGLTAAITRKFEELRKHTELAASKQLYGYGGFIVDRGFNGLGRDDVSAVYKLTETSGEPRMKWGNEAGLGKVSVPGHPVAWRRLRGSGPVSVIGQLGEKPPEDYVVLNGNPEALEQLRICNVDPSRSTDDVAYELSSETRRLVDSFGRAA